MANRVVFTAVAEADLTSLLDYIEEHSGKARALAYVGRIEAACQNLALFPERGVQRDDIRPRTRVISIGRRVLVAFHLNQGVVKIDRVLYGGRDLAAAFPD